MTNSGETEKTFNHNTAKIIDLISELGELEHAFWHAKRSAISLYDPDSEGGEEYGKYAIWAKAIQEMRREYQAKAFPELEEYDWCLLKSLSRVRQLAYETLEDYAALKALDELVDDITSTIFGVDLSGCAVCKEDRQSG